MILGDSGSIKISVLVPVYNVEKYVARCLSSILNQTMQKGVEVIIVNDCTPDHSMEIIHELLRTRFKDSEMMVRIIEHEKNRGIAAVRNTMMNCATGDYIIYIDSDDYVESNMLEKMYAKALETNADIVVSDYYKTYLDKEVYMNQTLYEKQEDNINSIFKCNLAAVLWNKLIRRNLYVCHDIKCDESFDNREDMAITIALFVYASKVVHVSEAYQHYVQYNSNSYTNNVNKKILEDWCRFFDYVKAFFIAEKLWDKYESACLKYKVYSYFISIAYTKGSLQQYYNEKYQDCFSYIVKANLGFCMKLALLCASYHMLWLFDILLGLHDILKNIKRKKYRM